MQANMNTLGNDLDLKENIARPRNLKMAKRQDIDPQQKKKRSRDAARQRRGQQNDEFFELASHLPVPEILTSQLDRLCIMRLTNSFVKMKHIIRQVTGGQHGVKSEPLDQLFDSIQLDALGGFLFVIGVDGVFIYCSPNVSNYLGISHTDITGNSVYKYVHPCDQEELANQLGGQVPLEDMEIFDGLFCADPGFTPDTPLRPVAKKKSGPSGNYRSFFLRMKSTLTSRGKSVNLNASIYRVVHCVGVVQEYQTKFCSGDGDCTRCLLAVGTPLLSSSTFEVPLDRYTFTSTHMMDMKLLECEDRAYDILGYSHEELVGKSWYTYAHGCDISVLKTCHDTMLSKGQSVSRNYRLLTKNGGWVWVQTKGNVVYSSATCQPQYILCVNHVISGIEAPDEVLSTDQMPSVIKISNKRPCKKECLENGERDCKIPRKAFHGESVSSDCDAESEELALSGLEELESLRRQQAEYEDKLVEEYSVLGDDDPDDDDLPSLEFLDAEDLGLMVEGTEELLKDDEFLMRAPFIPPPTVDEALYVPGCSPLTLIEDSEGSEGDTDIDYASRAPFIPPPHIDTILTFDDLPKSPLTMHEFAEGKNSEDCQNRLSGLLDDDTEVGGIFTSSKGLSMVQLGPAIVPLALLEQECRLSEKFDPGTYMGVQELTTIPSSDKGKQRSKTKPKQPSKYPPGKKHKSYKGKGKLSFVDGKSSVLPLVTSLDCEVNAPPGKLLIGPDLMLALDVAEAAS